MARPRSRDYVELRRDLVDAGAELLAAEGPSALSTRRVAQRAGVSTAAVYNLFGDKAGLVREMFVSGFARLADAFAAVPRTGDAMADLLALGHAYRASALANPHLYELMFGRPVPEFRPDAETAARIAPTFDALVTAVARCVDAGTLAPTDPQDLAVRLNALAHGLCSLELRGALGTTDEARTHWDAAFEAMLRGMTPHTTP
ncbi:TetR/AcrR family transcriptional regulator [Streptomyces sp. NPDC088387]|uniref:TetR/AcrR family transcriptional regulator n=1 Tax=Streptomyces sp. NPDC088387 TaxID=3365859 RepID=UPI0037F22110